MFNEIIPFGARLMQANNDPLVSIKYIESPLGKFLEQALCKITELKKKYPTNAADSSEKRHADALMKVLEEIISLAHNKVLPYFDQKKEPGFSDFLMIGLHVKSYTTAIRKLNELLTTSDYKYFTTLKESITKKALLATKKPLMIDAIRDFFTHKAQLHAGDGKKALFQKLDASIDAVKVYGQNMKGLMISTDPSKMSLHSLKDLLGGKTGFILFEKKSFYLSDHGLQKMDDLKRAATIDSIVEDIEFEVFKCPIPEGDLEQKAYQDFFATVPFQRIDFAITHPLMFELSELIINLIPQLPKELGQLVPFLNPKALSIKLFGLKHVEGEDLSVTSYSYKIREYKFDAAALYNKFFASFSALSSGYLFYAMNKYNSDFCGANFVKNEHFRCSFLQELKTLETQTIEQELNIHCLDYKLHQFIPEHQDIESMANFIKQLSSLLNDNIRLQQAWLLKNKAYDSPNLSALLGSHPVLTEKARQAKYDGLNLSFMDWHLPETLVGTTPGDPSGLLELIPIKGQLQKVMREKWQDLIAIEAGIKSNLEKCTMDYEQRLDVLRKQPVTESADFTKQQEECLTQLEQEACDYHKAPDDSPESILANLENMELLLHSNQAITEISPASPSKNPVEECIRIPEVAEEEQKAHSNPVPEQFMGNLHLNISKLGELSDTLRITAPLDADVIEKLGNTLINQLDALKKSNQKAHDYKQFKDTFINTLQSKDVDVVMSKYDNLWKPILVNLIIGVFSLGIALGIKALHSKVTTGQYSLFYAKTDREKVIDDIQQSLNDNIIC